MNNYETIYNLQTNELTQRFYTEEEEKEVEKMQAKIKKEAETFIKKTADKEVARQALLDKLGITADEAKLLLG